MTNTARLLQRSRKVFHSVRRGSIVVYRWSQKFLHRALEIWEEHANSDIGEPLYYPRLLWHYWQQGVKYLYALLGGVAVFLALAFAVANPFEGSLSMDFRNPNDLPVFQSGGGSIVLCGIFLLIAAFLFSHFLHLGRKERPEDH